MMFHTFNTNIAKKYGVNCAVILQNLYFWIEKNKANNKHFYDGNYWTYNSKKAFGKIFGYLSERQIDYALKKLIDDGVIITGNYNAVAYDRTLWYAITKKGYSILQNCEMEATKLLNENNKIVEPIPDNKQTDIKTDNKTDNIVEQVDEPASDTINEIISFLNEKAKSSYRSSTPKTRKLIGARLKEKFVLEDFKKVIEFKCQQWLGDAKMSAYLRPETLFGTKFESYLNEAKRGIGSQVLGSQATYSDEYLEKFRRKRG